MTSSLLPILPAIYDVLFNFAESDGFWANLETAFGTSYDVVKATEIQQQWQSRNFSQLPEIEVVNSSVLGSANGAYGISTNKIYLSESFFASASLDALVTVILEEIGHYVDAQINRVDTVGDEGELFSHLVRGVNLTEAELTYIQAEDDRAVIDLEGQFIGVEQTAPITLIVNTTIDENDGSATIGSGLSLRDAVTIANKSPNTPYIIKLKSGTTYALTYVNNTTTGDRSLNTNGTITIETDGTALASIVNNASPISGQNDNNSIIYNSSKLGVTLNNLYISNKAGRGIYNSGKLTLTNNTISGNTGGGIENNGTLTLTNNTISGNTAGYGGGIFSVSGGTLTLTNNTITGNTAGYGGGIFSGGTLTLTNNKITGNKATYTGGGIYTSSFGESTSTLLTNNTITGNTADSGGGIYISWGATSTRIINKNTITDNTAKRGGGIYANASGVALTLENNAITGNTADSGGGIYKQSGTLSSINNTIVGNTANDKGGGIYNDHPSPYLTLDGLYLNNNIITGNSADYGGGVFNRSINPYGDNKWYTNSIISGNTANKVWYLGPNVTSSYYPWYSKDHRHPDIFTEGSVFGLPPTPNPPPKPTISVSNARFDAPAGKVIFEVKLSSTYDKPITVDYYTLDGSANSIDPNQLKDFNNVVKQTLSFFPGQTSKQIEITVLGSAPPTDQTFEIFARDTAYRNWTDTDKGKEVDKIYDYSDLGYEGYRINKVFKDSTTGFDAFGLTSDEKFFLVLANPLNANEFTSNSNNLLQDIANTSGGNNTAAYTAGQNLINQLTSTKQSYTFTDGTIYDLAKPPVLAIRGTEFSSGKDLLSDTETEGVGYNQFNNNKAAINQWLSEVSNPVSGLTLKPHITGHSLGGALSQWVGGSYTGQLGKIVTFNSPGISQQPGINFNATNNLGVTHYITSADLVSIAGSKYLSGVWNLEKYSKLTSAITFEKHSVPVLNQTITRTNLSKPTDLTRKVANGNTNDLSSYWFTYLPDADYFALQAAVTLISPILGAALTYRGTVELNRKAIGSAIDGLGTISDAVTSAYNAAKSWTSDAWNAIIGQSDKKLGLSPSTANQSNSTLKLASSFLDTNSYEIATTATASQTIDNFWDAIPDWGDNAWQATTKWSGDAWKSIDEWTPQTWQATTTWTAADWDKPFFTISNPTIVENNSGTNNLIFKVILSTTSTQTITVNYATANNTATAGSDYTAKTGTITFTPGQISQDIIISVNGDTAIEPDETFLINLSNPSNALITDNQGLGTITNDDVTLPNITLAVSPASVTEDGTTNLVYTFTRTGSTTNPLTVNYTLGGTATLNTDYTRTGTTNTVTFAANSSTATVTVDPTADTTVESDETVTLTLAAGTGYKVGTTTPVTGTIKNDDVTLPSITLAISPSSVTEDGTTNLVYTFTRSGSTTNALTVNYTLGGTATLNTDYTRTGTTNTVTFAANSSTATITVDPTADTTVEPDETVILTLATGTGYTIGTTTAVTGTINNDDTNVTLAVSPSSVTEDGTSNLVYTFTRTGVTTNALTVNYTLGGTATLNTDYTRTGTTNTVTFAANSSTATVTVDPTADTIVEPDETVILTLAAGTGYTIGTATAVTGTITNDDFSKLSINNITVVEGQNSNAILTVTVDNPNPQQISVNYTTAPVNATANVDYTSKTGTITIAPNTSTATISIPILNDNLNEANETFAINLSNPVNATLSNNQGIVTISDTLTANVTTTLPANVENLTLNGTANINGTGNAANNILTGNSGNNTLNGGAGIDTLIGGLGNDTYQVDTTTDTITENANQGTDTVQSSVTYTLGNNLENLTLTGTANINGTGNTLNNIITGNSGNNTLNGSDGNDTLIGGTGNDTITGGTGSDRFTFNNRNEGIDTITDFLSSQGDKITVSAAGFGGGLAAGVAITTAQFVLGTTALNASNRFIYNTITGGLFFDGDGTGTLAAIQIATLSSKPTLTASDILVLV
ncbi:endo-1,3-1,4-beta-glycanase ExsH [Microcystis flos-aquae FACHB-1344]|uniref:Endo-1,3-1,4-beta-glycanase ExsH n=1 Tax=Microcystis flos-aquae FACHB-1344 TaxID=2692899 RepID=A0ABR8HN86_9CHRO|nr:Calx-beta domain-containing protein [Microcystis flos-aquae]MBD2620888.1 endo-1,3-1,4-beta-glycanase ExsH [Microcystis flos-aquae FACHB-1344]